MQEIRVGGNRGRAEGSNGGGAGMQGLTNLTQTTAIGVSQATKEKVNRGRDLRQGQKQREMSDKLSQ